MARPQRLSDFKPLLKDLFEEKGSQSAEELQTKIEQLQKLQKLLQLQQEGLLQRPQTARCRGRFVKGLLPLAEVSPPGPVRRGGGS